MLLTAIALTAAPLGARAQDAAAPDGVAAEAAAQSPPSAPSVQEAEIEKALSSDRAAATAASQPGTEGAGMSSGLPGAPVDGPVPAGTGAGAAAHSMNPDIAVIADIALAWFSNENPEGIQTGEHDPKANGFNLQQLEFAIGKAVDPYFRFDSFIIIRPSQTEDVDAATGARSINKGFELEVEEVYATTMSLPANLQLRIGQFLTRFGRFNATHPHTWDFVDQPFEIGRLFGSDGNRGLGMELSYLTPLPWYVELVGSVTDATGSGTARSFMNDQALRVESPGDMQTTLALKQFFPVSDDWSLMWGLSGALGPVPGDQHSEIAGTDLYLKFRPITRTSTTIVSLQAEWFFRRRPESVTGSVRLDTGGFATLFWRFAQRWAAAVRYEYGSPTWNTSWEVRPDDLNPEWTDGRYRISTALTFWPTEFSRIRLQGARDRRGWVASADWSAFLAFEFSVGAHGAHAF